MRLSLQPLRQDKKQIRLVVLEPGASKDPIRCTMKVVSLEKQPKYEALSYHWGDKSGPQIAVDENLVRIQANLFDALRTLRSVEYNRVLWIDALCINQHDDDEKSWQVGLMGEIYQSSKRSVLFLGRGFEESDRWCDCPSSKDKTCPDTAGRNFHFRNPDMREIYSFLCQLAAGGSVKKDAHINNIPTVANLLNQSDNMNDLYMEPIQAMGALLRRPWWSRMWTAQEAILPTETSIICGSVRIPWKTMVDAAENWDYHTTHGCCNPILKAMEKTLAYRTRGMHTSEIMTEFVREVRSIEEIRNKRARRKEVPFLPVLRHFGHRKASNPLDKVYALLGLVDQKSRPCSIAYDRSKRALNQELSIHFLKSPRNPFQALYGTSRSPDPQRHPSWIVDFTRVSGKTWQRLEDYRDELRRTYHAADFKDARIKVPDGTHPKSISVQGFRVDRVKHATKVCESRNAIDQREFARLCAGIIDFSRRKDLSYPSDRAGKETYLQDILHRSTSRTVAEAFGRAILGSRCRNHSGNDTFRALHPQDLESVRDWVSAKYPTLKDGLMQQVRCSVAGRKFFTTRGGLMGFGPSQMHEGDEVWLIYGDQVPFILRPLGKSNGQKELGIVGDCYVQGIMEGEVKKDVTKSEVVLL
ncbi:heterokaryon incompatibility protein-domain-containing protein [Xylariaceae sp. FL0662B]|nr:heterokaryon incompatibility protein-domain-containing protein [Xylariaceae sp. FL0662B]